MGTVTLVRRERPASSPRAVALHVHGRNDYFFQEHLAAAFESHGYVFLAVDMRRAGRSLRDGELPHHITDISELGHDITTAVTAVSEMHPHLPVVVHAHSTGGLAAAVWAAKGGHPSLAALVLNSPLFGVPMNWQVRLGMLAAPAVARLKSTVVVSNDGSTYAYHQHRDNGGRWEFDTAWKNPEGEPVTAGWISAVTGARRHLRPGATFPCPVLIAHSDATGPDSSANPHLDSQDTVVDVQAIKRVSAGLQGVTMLEVRGGVHDLSLSAPGPREEYFSTMFDWLEEVTT